MGVSVMTSVSAGDGANVGASVEAIVGSSVMTSVSAGDGAGDGANVGARVEANVGGSVSILILRSSNCI